MRLSWILGLTEGSLRWCHRVAILRRELFRLSHLRGLPARLRRCFVVTTLFSYIDLRLAQKSLSMRRCTCRQVMILLQCSRLLGPRVLYSRERKKSVRAQFRLHLWMSACQRTESLLPLFSNWTCKGLSCRH